jgi:molybdenum cofactor biosynthesis enzyme MoaA
MISTPNTVVVLQKDDDEFNKLIEEPEKSKHMEIQFEEIKPITESSFNG